VIGDNPIFSCQAKSEEILKSTTYRTALILGIPPPQAPPGTFEVFGDSLATTIPVPNPFDKLRISSTSIRYATPWILPIIPYPGYRIQPRQKYGGQGPAHNELSISKTFIACPVGPKDPTGSPTGS